jgi:hypothetical protein
LIVILRRAGLRIQEALALAEADLDPRSALLVRSRSSGQTITEIGRLTPKCDQVDHLTP